MNANRRQRKIFTVGIKRTKSDRSDEDEEAEKEKENRQSRVCGGWILDEKIGTRK
jgi:hypothetical protein